MGWRDVLGLAAKEHDSESDEIRKVRASRNVTVLARALDDDSVLVRVAAAQTLGNVRDDAAGRALTEAMKSMWRSVRVVAGESLAKIAERGSQVGVALFDIGDISPEDLRQRREMMTRLSADRLTHYIKGLGDEHAEIRFAAAEVLGETGSPDAVPPLINALKDEAWEVVSEACEAIQRIGAASVPSLLESTDDTNPMVRSSVAWCLGRIGDNKARPSLEKLMRDESEQVREAAESALKDLTAKDERD